VLLQRLARVVQVPYAIGGSGSMYISGWIDKNWRTGMTAEEGSAFCIRAVSHAFHRDGSSGGCVRMVTVTKEGYKEEFVPHTETPQGYGELAHPAQSQLPDVGQMAA
jgi:20S proteasome subunit beta 1